MKTKLSDKDKKEFVKVLDSLGESLDITKTQHENLVRSYNAVGEFLMNDDTFSPYHPIVSPQGSLRLGTIIQPICPNDDLDVDLVFRLLNKDFYWTQKYIKDKVGKRLKSSSRYAPMVDSKEGRRCWTLKYRNQAEDPNARYHMDILPCVAGSNYDNLVNSMMEKQFSTQNARAGLIHITDKKLANYDHSIFTDEWLNSNPDGYAYWFATRCNLVSDLALRCSSIKDIIPIDKYREKKLPLQRIVQILKRHRDYMFAHDTEDKPISIIITTLAAKAYNGESNILDGLINVTQNMNKFIERNDNGEFWIRNPLDPEENFADKWAIKPKKKENFFLWLKKVQEDILNILGAEGSSWQKIIGENFGNDVLKRTNSIYADKYKRAMTAGALSVSSCGTLGAIGRVINNANTFYGNEEE